MITCFIFVSASTGLASLLLAEEPLSCELSKRRCKQYLLQVFALVRLQSSFYLFLGAKSRGKRCWQPSKEKLRRRRAAQKMAFKFRPGRSSCRRNNTPGRPCHTHKFSRPVLSITPEILSAVWEKGRGGQPGNRPLPFE